MKRPTGPKSVMEQEDEGGGGGKVVNNTKDSTKTGGGGGGDGKFSPYIKQGYKRCFPENFVSKNYTVFIESKINQKIGNKNPFYFNNLLQRDIKGVDRIERISAARLAITFNLANDANNFLKNEEFLDKHSYRAFISAKMVESIGVIRHVPTEVTNEDLFKKLSCEYEIIQVRRFTKKINQQVQPLETLSVTFLSPSLPECVYYEKFRFKVSPYIPPLLQCYKCFGFNHSSKICKHKQVCSLCAEEHFYKDCPQSEAVKCKNCGGAHLAISRLCPVKAKKIEDNRNKQMSTYASIVGSAKLSKKYELEFPSLKPTKSIQMTPPSTVNTIKNFDYTELGKDDKIINALVVALLELANNKEENKLTRAHIGKVIKDSLKSIK